MNIRHSSKDGFPRIAWTDIGAQPSKLFELARGRKTLVSPDGTGYAWAQPSENEAYIFQDPHPDNGLCLCVARGDWRVTFNAPLRYVRGFFVQSWDEYDGKPRKAAPPEYLLLGKHAFGHTMVIATHFGSKSEVGALMQAFTSTFLDYQPPAFSAPARPVATPPQGSDVPGPGYDDDVI